MAREFKNFYRTVGSNEGEKCHYPTRLDMYGCGCSHDCTYCYAKAIMEFRRKWNPKDPAVVNIAAMKRKIAQLEPGSIVRLGGLTDCFQPIEAKHRATYEAIKALNMRGVGYLIVTKSAMIADDEYMKILDRKLAHIQISITSTDDKLAATYEKASATSKRIEAIEKLAAAGYDVAVRLSPLIPGYYDVDVVNAIKCDKLLVEFLRYEKHIIKTFPIDWSDWIVWDDPYGHLTLEKKKELLSQLTGFKEISVCEDCTEHYKYWRDHFNPNPNDCCNLSISKELLEFNEQRRLSEKRLRTRVQFKLKVSFPDGTILTHKNVKETYMATIEKIGADVVRALGIERNGSPLITGVLSEVPDKWKPEMDRDRLSNGMCLFTHMSTDAKAKTLMEIAEKTNIGFKVEYVSEP